MNPRIKNIILAIVVALIIGTISYLQSKKPARLTSDTQDIVLEDESVSASSTSSLSTSDKKIAEERSVARAQKSLQYSRAKELVAPQGFINIAPFKLSDIVGKKVVLIDFWTYSCINCQRTIPHLKEWYKKYKDQGLEIVGVHAPEFDFEKVYDNVLNAVKDAGITYPVVLDSNKGTWGAYQNNYWPREYLIDIDGFIIYDHIGEGAYEETEKAIQEALKERASVLGEKMNITKEISSIPSDNIQAASPETYFGFARNEYLANGTPQRGGEQTFEKPATIAKNLLYLSGIWNMKEEYAESSSGGKPIGISNTIDYRYSAKRVYFVAGSITPVDVEVLRDGKPLDRSFAGADIFYKDGKSYVKIEGNRLYKIIEDTVFGEHLLELKVISPGLQAYTFTFG